MKRLNDRETRIVCETAQYAKWALNHIDPIEEQNHTYVLGCVESVAHMIACTLVQRLGFKEGVGTGETIDAIDPHPNLTVFELEGRIGRYVQALRSVD